MGNPTVAFFSYSRHDSEFVLKLAKDLRAAGAAVWLDQLDIPPGERWDSTVEKALAISSNLLVILSPESVDSTNVMDEVSFALEEKKRVIPVLYRECKIPFRLRRLQYIDFRAEYERGLAELVPMLRSQEPPAVDAIQAGKPTTQGSVEAEAREREKGTQERTARETAEAERVAQAEAAQERAARQRVEAEQQAARKAMEVAPVGAATGSPNRKYLIAGAAALVAVVVLALALSGKFSSPTPTPTAEPRPSPSTTSEPAKNVAPTVPPASTTQQSQPNTTEWVKQFLIAGQGPDVNKIRPFYDDIVSPYFGMPSATWSVIEDDKLKYFTRFPTIHYVLLGQPVVTPLPGGGDLLEIDMQYSEIRRDGQTLEGTSHLSLNIRSVDGQWKITGVRERKVR